MKKDKVFYDKKTDSLYISIKKGREESFEEVEPNVIIEYNKRKEPIGIEILNVSQAVLNKIKPLSQTSSLLHDKTSIYKPSSK